MPSHTGTHLTAAQSERFAGACPGHLASRLHRHGCYPMPIAGYRGSRVLFAREDVERWASEIAEKKARGEFSPAGTLARLCAEKFASGEWKPATAEKRALENEPRRKARKAELRRARAAAAREARRAEKASAE